MKKYLLADDDSDDKELFAEALRAIDPSIVCYCATDGQEVIDNLLRGVFQTPEIIFLDINMPGMNGWECLVSLKKHPSFKDIPVIMYSTSSNRRERELAIEFGAIGFFTKPTEFARLKEILSFLVAADPADTEEVAEFLAK